LPLVAAGLQLAAHRAGIGAARGIGLASAGWWPLAALLLETGGQVVLAMRSATGPRPSASCWWSTG
jgi:hypothetical protein